MNSMDAPCKDCKDRHIGCHSKCSKYADFRRELKKRRRYARENYFRDDEDDRRMWHLRGV